MKKLLALFLSFILAVSCLSVGAVADTTVREIEDNGTVADANLFTDTITGAISSKNDIDYYKFNSTGNYFTVSLKVNSEFLGVDVGYGWDMYIYDSLMNQLSKYTDIKTEKISARLAFKGTFYVKVVSSSSSKYPAADYDLTVTQTINPYWESEENNDLKTATPIAVGKAYTGSLRSTADVDYYKAYVTGDYFVVNFDVAPEYMGANVKNGWNIYVYNSLGESICGYTVNGVAYTKKLAYSGNVYIKVVSNSKYSCPTGIEYRVAVNQTVNALWETEDTNNQIKKADALKYGSNRQGTIINKNDIDYYKISIPTSGTAKVSFSRSLDENDGNGYKVCFRNSAGTIIKSVTVDGTLKGSISSLKVSKGTYYVTVSAASSYKAPSSEITYKVSYTFKPSTPSLKKVAAAKKAVKVYWKQAKYVDGYQIQYATTKSFKKAKTTTVKKYKTTNKTIKKLKAKKTYYVRVRTYKTVDGKKVYSSWSKAKKAKTKK